MYKNFAIALLAGVIYAQGQPGGQMKDFNCQTENVYEDDMMAWFMSGADTSDIMGWTH